MKPNRCIWCLSTAGGNHREHIIPEPLGCPDHFILSSDVICESCNNGMGHLDQAVSDDFDFVTFQAGIPRKKGRSPKIASRGNVYAAYGESGPHYVFNMDNTPVKAPGGEVVAPYKGQPRNVNASFETMGQQAAITFDFSIGESRKFQRGIYKMAISALAYYLGASEIYKPKYNSIRQYVRKGSGHRHFILYQEKDFQTYQHEFNSPYISPDGNYIVTFRLAIVRFIVDLSENQSELPALIETAHREVGKTGWTVVPID